MNTKTQIIATILNCSEENADFLAELCNNFKTDFKYVWQITNDFYPDYHITDVINVIYQTAIDDAIELLKLKNNYNEIQHLIKTKINGHNSLLSFDKKECPTYASLVHAIQSYFEE